MGDVVLSLMLRDRGLMPKAQPRSDVVVIPVGAELAAAARQITTELRRAGKRAETPYSPTGVGKDLKATGGRGIPYAVIVGPEEWAAREVNLKDLRTGEQTRIALDALATKIKT